MNDKELLEYMRKVDTNFNTHLENGTIEMSLEYYNLCAELMTRGINAIQENEQLKKEIKEYQEELSKADSITQSCIFDGAKESAISYRECLNELDKYKSLYENEKDHTDTLKRIIKKIEEYIKNIDEEEFINTEHYVEILDLLKEIK